MTLPAGCRLHIDDANGVRTFTIDNPGRKNALSLAVRAELSARLLEADADLSVRVVVITGQGANFCSGADLTEVPRHQDALGAHRYMSHVSQQVARSLLGMRTPVVARVRGAAAGAGMMLALLCDVVVASDDAGFAVSQLKLGIPPDWMALWLLPRMVGRARARSLLWKGAGVSAATAAAWGLIAEAVEPDCLDATVQEYCASIRGMSPLAAALTKDGLSQASEGSLESFAAWEAAAIGLGLVSTEFEQNVAAFLERRQSNH